MPEPLPRGDAPAEVGGEPLPRDPGGKLLKRAIRE